MRLGYLRIGVMLYLAADVAERYALADFRKVEATSEQLGALSLGRQFLRRTKERSQLSGRPSRQTESAGGGGSSSGEIVYRVI